MNELLQDIEQLEGYVNKLKKLKHIRKRRHD